MKAMIPHWCIQKFSQYNVWNILLSISQYSKMIYNSQTDEIGGALLKKSTSGKIHITAWGLVDMAYFAVQYCSRESCAKMVSSEKEFIDLFHIFFTYQNELDRKRRKEYRKNLRLFVYSLGGEQTKYQMIKPPFDDFFRSMYIIDVIMRRSFPNIDIDQIVYKKFNMDIIELCTVLFSVWVGSADKPIAVIDITNANSLLRKNSIVPILDYYSCTLEEINNSQLKRQIFYSKPLIRTPDKNFIVSNYYLLLYCFQECVYWIVRDYYFQKGSREFTSTYGKCFEIYFRELLQEYLREDQFEKIQEDKTQKADWKLSIGEFKILVEQKSSLIFIDAKQQTPDMDKAISFVKSNWGKAIRQLHNTEKEYNDGPYIKIILITDDYYIDEVLDTVFEVDNSLPENDGRYWLVTIDMMEALLYTYKNSPEVFFDIMKEKNRLELDHSNEGRSLFTILNRFGIESNEHINQQRFTQYKDKIFEILQKDLGEDDNGN